MTTRDPRRRTHVDPDADAPATRDGEVQSTDASDPTTAAPGIPIARPDPSKPYPEEDEETRAASHVTDVEAKSKEQAVVDKAAADKAAEAKAEADAEAAKAKE